MSRVGGGPGHLDDGALVRVLDGESAEAESEHAQSCLACRERLDALRTRSDRFVDRLTEADRPVPSPGWDPTFLDRIGVAAEGGMQPETGPSWWPSARALRWAAVVVVLVGAAAAPPVRAFLAETVRAFVMDTGGRTTAAGDPSSVEVAVDGPRLRLLLEDGVTLRLVPGEAGSRATARIEGAAGGAEILARADGFTVAGAGAGAVVEVAVPSTVRGVRVDWSGGATREVAVTGDTAVVVAPPGGG